MFLVDKYYNDSNQIICQDTNINKIIDSFDYYNSIYDNIENIKEMDNNSFLKFITDINYNKNRYSNFQHLILYGCNDSGKLYIINKLLENIYGRVGMELKDVEYIVSGYSNTKTKIIIKQSKNHIIIEPNSNGFDKYLIQEIIQEYAKSEILNIFEQSKLFKIVIINKIDNLSYYAQASLRRTMEKYSDKCKFILISEQLSKIIEPLRSRSLLIRVPCASFEQILQVLLNISYKENIQISPKSLYNIINTSDNNINNAIWLLDMYRYNINYDNNWIQTVNDIVNNIVNVKINNKLYKIIKQNREKFYLLFITNIPTQLIIRTIYIKIIEKINNRLDMKYDIINIISKYENRLNQGTRHIIHVEALIVELLNLFIKYSNKYTQINKC
jgi:replication factor C subunit 3/5